MPIRNVWSNVLVVPVTSFAPLEHFSEKTQKLTEKVHFLELWRTFSCFVIEIV